MKRRTFIGLLGASALSVPFMLAERGLGLAGHNNRATASKSKVPLKLKLPRDISHVAARLGPKSKGVYLLGGASLVAASGEEIPYVNLLIDSPEFGSLKQSLFELGVAPVSTADLPANFIRFVYQDRPYNVLNMNFDTYMQLSMTGQENGLILFAHNFLVYSIDGAYALDPYQALESKTAKGDAYVIKLLRQPRTLLHGFEHCLAATFDTALLGLKPSPPCRQAEERVLNSTTGPTDSKEIFSRVLDYSPDILEVAGFESASRFLTAPVCVAAGKAAAGIDFTHVDAHLRELQGKGVAVTGKEFMTSVHFELKKKNAGQGSAQGLPEYVMANKEQFRRVELLIDSIDAIPA